MRTTKATEKALSAIMERADREIQAIADAVRRERVIPACRRIRGSFCSGMGTFSFYDQRGFPIMEHEAEKFGLDAIYETLNIEVYYGQYLGFWVSDVKTGE